MIFAIDQSLTESGMCIMWKNYLNDWMWATFVIKTKKLRGIERLEFIKKEIERLLDVNPFIENAAMEGYSYGSIGRTFELGELGGIVKFVFNSRKIPLEIVPPTVWKKEVCGKGNYNKARVMLEVKKKYGIEFKNDNECDAWCIAKYLRQKLYK